MADSKKTDLAALHQMIDSIAASISPLVTAYAASEEAHAEKQEAQVSLVAAILHLMYPSVHALGTRPIVLETMRNLGHPNEKLASWRGLVLTCPVHEALMYSRGPRPTEEETGSSGGPAKGTYGGNHVFLREDGNLVALFYEGSWNERTENGIYDEWRAIEREVSVETFCRDWASAADPKKLAAQLLKFIEKAGDRSKAIAKARELTDKYRAIVALL